MRRNKLLNITYCGVALLLTMRMFFSENIPAEYRGYFAIVLGIMLAIIIFFEIQRMVAIRKINKARDEFGEDFQTEEKQEKPSTWFKALCLQAYSITMRFFPIYFFMLVIFNVLDVPINNGMRYIFILLFGILLGCLITTNAAEYVSYKKRKKLEEEEEEEHPQQEQELY